MAVDTTKKIHWNGGRKGTQLEEQREMLHSRRVDTVTQLKRFIVGRKKGIGTNSHSLESPMEILLQIHRQ